VSGARASLGAARAVAWDDLDERKRAAVPERVIAPIRDRWSPRAFADRPVSQQALRSVLEAARWAPSSFNEQPWRFLVATRDDPAAFATALSCLREKNAAWARSAPVLLLTVVKRTFSNSGGENRTAQHDLGLAIGNLTAQATALGLSLHQMGGVRLERIREVYAVPEEYEPVTAIALGYRADPEALPDDLQAKERRERSRKPLSELVFSGAFGRPARLTGEDA
jgi:nitroreductase